MTTSCKAPSFSGAPLDGQYGVLLVVFITYYLSRYLVFTSLAALPLPALAVTAGFSGRWPGRTTGQLTRAHVPASKPRSRSARLSLVIPHHGHADMTAGRSRSTNLGGQFFALRRWTGGGRHSSTTNLLPT
ncbi:hypothetical protein V8C37DRAFT_338643 [Trichoderma ceciliae]